MYVPITPTAARGFQYCDIEDVLPDRLQVEMDAIAEAIDRVEARRGFIPAGSVYWCGYNDAIELLRKELGL